MRVVIGVCGGIAAYKAADLTSRLVKAGCETRVVMTEAATRFVGPLTFEALSGHPTLVDVLETGSDVEGSSTIRHISWARWADLVVVAPLTAATLGRLACGIAEDALTTLILAVRPEVPVLLCPAMNTQMWLHPIVQRNVAWLTQTGRFTVLDPTDKRLACGEIGVGGLPEVHDLVAAVLARRGQ